ncbi:acetyl-CoA carboxylase biotin carboxyl carrier protein [Clostridium sardiniense]|uniref:acetyl-CoA carboxylase biotin carboxyl carrier protein n=1 Tax=Clostridium sardiniense TaxID=29369 RepID=UPI003C3456E2
MNINEVKELIELINTSELAYFEYKSGDSHIKMDKSLTRGVNVSPSKEVKSETITEKIHSEKMISEVIDEVKEEVKEEPQDIEGTVVTSPMVGTFYGSPSPDSDSFVKVGDNVKKGSVLCIIEAMKLMNEIESEVSGSIVQVLVKDGDMVEYGTPLFKIREDV